MSRVLIVQKVQDILDANGQSDKGPEIAREYATVVNLVNRRLENCKMYLDSGKMGEAFRIAEERPPLLTFCAMLLFDRLPIWHSLCQIKGWQSPDPINIDAAQALQEAFHSPASIEPLNDLQREATQANELRMAVRCLRRLAKLEPSNQTRLATLNSFENRFLTELKDQFFPAAALKNIATMHRIAEEIELSEWSIKLDPSLLAAIATMRQEEKSVPVESITGAADSDLFQTTHEEQPTATEDKIPFIDPMQIIVETSSASTSESPHLPFSPPAAPAPTPEPASPAPPHQPPPPPKPPKLEVTTTKIEDIREPGWTPKPKHMLIACAVLAFLVIAGIIGLVWYGNRNFEKACETLVAENQQLLTERGGPEYDAIKTQIKNSEYKTAYQHLRKLVQTKNAEAKAERRTQAEKDSAQKLAEQAALEKKKAEEAEAEKIRLEAEKVRLAAEAEAEKVRLAQEEIAAKKRAEEEALRKVAEAEAEKIRIAKEEADAKQKVADDLRKKREEAERLRQEALAKKRAEEAEILRKQREEEDRVMNAGFGDALYMAIDLSGGMSTSRYPIAYYKTLADVPGGVQSEVYKTSQLLLRYIAPGHFLFGCPQDQLGADELQPVQEMVISNGFFIGVFEVTQKQWNLIMGNNPSYFETAATWMTRPIEQVSVYDIREDALTNKDDPLVEWPQNHEVNRQSFMGRLRKKTYIRTFDLPTEIQWEYACRAGTKTALNSGKNLSDMYIDPNLSEMGRYYSNGGKGYKRDGTTIIMTATVGSYKPNAWGLYDMHGNVAELCFDHYNISFNRQPQWKGKIRDQYCVLRGGGWDNQAWHCTSTARKEAKSFQRHYNAGFRIIRNKP
jgi:formylglycine-generating enzyme required for sulfatase activity